MTYYHLKQNLTLDDIKTHNVSEFFKFQMEKACFKDNIEPVIMDMIRRDGETLPPKALIKKSPGRPKEKRMRRRSKFSNNNNNTCTICKESGHNRRTCPTLAVGGEDDKGKKAGKKRATLAVGGEDDKGKRQGKKGDVGGWGRRW
jgi:hypothetical protein